jgi:hypothetical protein
MRGLFAASRRNGKTGSSPLAPRALAIPAKHVRSFGAQHAVPPGVYACGQDAGGANATLWKSAFERVSPRLVSQELNWSLMGPPLFMLERRFPPKARLFRRSPTEVTVVPLSPSMFTSVPLLKDVLL